MSPSLCKRVKFRLSQQKDSLFNGITTPKKRISRFFIYRIPWWAQSDDLHHVHGTFAKWSRQIVKLWTRKITLYTGSSSNWKVKSHFPFWDYEGISSRDTTRPCQQQYLIPTACTSSACGHIHQTVCITWYKSWCVWGVSRTSILDWLPGNLPSIINNR